MKISGFDWYDYFLSHILPCTHKGHHTTTFKVLTGGMCVCLYDELWGSRTNHHASSFSCHLGGGTYILRDSHGEPHPGLVITLFNLLMGMVCDTLLAAGLSYYLRENCSGFVKCASWYLTLIPSHNMSYCFAKLNLSRQSTRFL